MKSAAILIGNAEYDHEGKLPCCQDDARAMQSLLTATDRFDDIHLHVNLDADQMRNAVRDALSLEDSYDEVLFYFSGHGNHMHTDLFLCGTNFDSARPNETGLSHGDLMDIFRSISPTVLTTVFDTCFSGTPLVKRQTFLPEIEKKGLQNVIQFSSSLLDQTSLAGEKISQFTRAFLEASVRKREGVIYYTDVKNALRDDFIGNNDQTPFFVNQGTGREFLTDDAKKLDGFRKELATVWLGSSEGESSNGPTADDNVTAVPAQPLSPLQALAEVEERMGNPEDADILIGKIFEGVREKFDAGRFSDFFETKVSEHSDYYEQTAREFMIRVLAREDRQDRMVTAEIKREKRRQPSWQTSIAMLTSINQEWEEYYDLELNCTLSRAQMSLVLTPKFRALKLLRLVLSCAPSLGRCYFFEVLTAHPRSDWQSFADDGAEKIRRWYKLDWDADPQFLIDKICHGLECAIEDHIETMAKRVLD